jgi:hypothetical protein
MSSVVALALRPIGDPDGTGGGEDKTLLVCSATPA